MRLAVKVPTRDRWTRLKDCGAGIAVLRMLEATARDLESLVNEPKRASGPRPKQYYELSEVVHTLRSRRLDLGEITDLIMSSNEDWNIPPCPKAVKHYGRFDASGGVDGRTALKAFLKTLLRRHPKIPKGKPVRIRPPVEIT
jgi:hypothetical protein